jgi:hypothetical protein
VDLAAVIGDEAAGWACGEGVDEHAEGEREQPLGDALDQAGRGLGEVLFEPHLAFEVGVASGGAHRFLSRPFESRPPRAADR